MQNAAIEFKIKAIFMIRIALVENDSKDMASLREAIKNYLEINNLSDCEISEFNNALSFLDNKTNFDLAFLDILMPNMNGMDLAKKIRESNDMMLIVFVTNLMNYAIKGYEVNAIDYIVKPVNKDHLFKTMDKALKAISSIEKVMITLKNKSSVKVVDSNDVAYLEVSSHLITYHFMGGETFEVWGTLKEEMEKLNANEYIRINNSQVVHIKLITFFDANKVNISKETLYFSRSYKKDAYNAILDYFSSRV